MASTTQLLTKDDAFLVIDESCSVALNGQMGTRNGLITPDEAYELAHRADSIELLQANGNAELRFISKYHGTTAVYVHPDVTRDLDALLS